MENCPFKIKMIGQDDRWLNSDGARIIQNEAKGFDCSAENTKLNSCGDFTVLEHKHSGLQSDSSQTDDAVADAVAEADPLPRVESYVTKPVRNLIHLFENPKNSKTSLGRLNPNIIQKPDSIMGKNSNEEIKIETARPPLTDIYWEFVGQQFSQTAKEDLICKDSFGEPVEADHVFSPVSPTIPQTLDNFDIYEKITQNVITIDNKAELDQILKSAGSKLVFLFFFRDDSDENEPFYESCLLKILEIASQEPNAFFLTVFITTENGDSTEWNEVVDSVQTCSIVGLTCVLFQNSVRIHESVAYFSKALGSTVAGLLAKYQVSKPQFLKCRNAAVTSDHNEVPASKYPLEWTCSGIEILTKGNGSNFVSQACQPEEISLIPATAEFQDEAEFEKFLENTLLKMAIQAGHQMEYVVVSSNQETVPGESGRVDVTMQETIQTSPNFPKCTVQRGPKAKSEVDYSSVYPNVLNAVDAVKNSMQKRLGDNANSKDLRPDSSISQDSWNKFIRDNELKQNLEEGGDITVIELDYSLGHGKLLPKLDQIGAQHRATSKKCRSDSKALLETLISRYPDAADLEPTTLVKNWTSFFLPSNLQIGFQTRSALVRSVNTYSMLKLHLNVAKSDLVLLTLIPYLPDHSYISERRLELLEIAAAQHTDVRMLSAQVFQSARTTTPYLFGPTLLFYKDQKLVHEELWDECMNELAKWITMLK